MRVPAEKTPHPALAEFRQGRRRKTGRANMGGIPKFLRPIAGAFFFKPVIAKGFPKKGKGPAIMAPAHEPMPREQLLRRLDDEVESIARAQFLRRLYAFTVNTHFAAFDRLLRKRSRLEETGGPEPFVDAHVEAIRRTVVAGLE